MEEIIFPCYECRTEDADGYLRKGAVNSIECRECGKMWSAPEHDKANAHTGDDYFDQYRR